MEQTIVPVVDMSEATVSGNRLAVAKRLVHAMETVGFLYLDGIPGYNEDELLECVKWFFDLPLERRLEVAKKQYNPTSKQLYRGYFGLNPEDVSYKEGYEFGLELCQDDEVVKSAFPLYEPNIWPSPATEEEKQRISKFKDTISSYYKIMLDASVEFMHLLAIGLSLPDAFFDPLFLPRTLSTLRLMHYPKRQFSPPSDACTAEGEVLCCGAHSDAGFATLLATFDDGLQVMLEDGTWFDVRPRPGSVVVNLGSALASLTNGRVKATEHRVREIGRSRYSVPFFFEPQYHAQVPTHLPLEDVQHRSLPSISDVKVPGSYQYGPWMIENSRKYVEYQTLNDYFP